MWSVIILFMLYSSVFVQTLSTMDPLVSTKVGLIRGLKFGDGYAKFLGIPYAVVDTNNPFGPSKPHPGFENTFEAYKSTECLQVHNDVGIGTLDCLTLNIYVPSIADSRHLPVMVWIHGGGFVGGSANGDGMSPNFLLKKDVIVVGINYRLGAYGFMCLDIPEVPGNQGLKDQVLALRWINENIESFGGNPKEITIFGESAGGISINLHLLSSYENLFQRAIIQSGSALTHFWTKDSDTTVPVRLAKELDFNTTDIHQALEHLSRIDAHTIIKAAHDLSESNSFQYNNTLKGPTVEKALEGTEHFITKHPRHIVPSKARTIPVIIGNNDEEAAVIFEVVEKFYETFDIGDHLKLAFDFNHNDLEEAVEAVMKFYVGEEKIDENIKRGLIDFVSDFYFNYPTEIMAEQLAQNGAPVYRYIFSYSGGRNYIKTPLKINSTGATHGDELGYLFDYKKFEGVKTPEDQLMIDRMTTIWTNFAKFGDPTPEKTELLPVKWDPISKTSHPYLDINSDLSIKARPFHDRMAFWDLFYKLYGRYQIL